MTSNTFSTTTAEMREHLQLLRLERALADAEIASLRAQLSGQARG